MTVIPALSNDITVPLQYFFAFVDVDGTPQYHESQDSFSLDFKFRYLLEDELHVNSLKARMVPINGGQSRDIWLERSGATVMKSGSVRLQFQSNIIIPGTYIIKQIILSVGRMTLSYEAEEKPQVFNAGSRFLRCPRIILYQCPDAFDIKLSASKYMHLDRNRSLEVELSSGWNDVLHGELHIRAATAGLRLQTSEATVITGKLEILKNAEVGTVRFGAFESGTFVKIRVPFNLEREVNDISLKLEVSYTTEEGTFSYAYNHNISIMLSLGVNVQDVFKHRALFSKFTISSATSSPLRLLNSRLKGSDVFDASSSGPLANPIMIFPRQPASLLYKITRRTQGSNRSKEKASLSLILDYICLEEEIDSAVTLALTEALHGTPFWQYSRLLVPTVLTQLRSLITSYDMERTAITEELSTSMLNAIKWRSHFVGIGNSKRQGGGDMATLLTEWLETWLKQKPTITLLPIKRASLDETPNSRQIIIPVDVPSVTVVHTADFKIPKMNPSRSELLAFTNQAIPASLHIKWTQRWNTKLRGETDHDLEFVYDVSAPSDTWLIGGKRKGHFRIPVGSTSDMESPRPLEFPVMLIPLREGYLPYPNLEIRPVPAGKGAAHLDRNEGQSPVVGDDESKNKDGAGGILSEIDYKNVGEVIRVISNAEKTTVSLDASGPQGGAWLLECVRRGKDGDVLVG